MSDSLAKKFKKSLFKNAKRSRNDSLRESSTELLSTFPLPDKDVFSFLMNRMEKTKYNKKRAKYFELLINNGYIEEAIKNDQQAKESFNRTVLSLAQSPTYYKDVLYNLDKIPSLTSGQIIDVHKAWLKNKKQKNNVAEYYFTNAIEKLPSKEQLKILTDDNWGDKKSRNKIRMNFYLRYYMKNADGSKKEMPISYVPLYIKEVLKQKKKTPFLGLLTNVSLKNESDEKKLINQIKKQKFSAEIKANIIKSLPQSIFQKESLIWMSSLYENETKHQKLYEESIASYLFRRKSSLKQSDIMVLKNIYRNTKNLHLRDLIERAGYKN
jgi:hypothetical protein